MLAYLLGLVVSFGSLAIYLSAFFFPEIHRKNDFIWSGVGLFYALILWIFAPRITGGLLLGHVASVALLVWFGWQIFSLRRQLIPEGQKTPLPSPELVKVSLQEQISKFSVQEKLGQLTGFVDSVFNGAKTKVQQILNKKPVIKTETKQSSKLPNESVTVPSAIATEAKTESLLEETVSESPVLETVELAPIIEEKEEQVVSSIEVTKTEILVAVEKTIEATSESPAISSNPVISELLSTEVGEGKPAIPVEEVKPEGEALPEQIPLDKPSGD